MQLKCSMLTGRRSNRPRGKEKQQEGKAPRGSNEKSRQEAQQGRRRKGGKSKRQWDRRMLQGIWASGEEGRR